MALHIDHTRPKLGRQQTTAAPTGCSRPQPTNSTAVLDQTDGSPSEYLNPEQASKYLGGLSTSFLAKLRMEENRHRGPAFVKIGRRVVVYRRADLDRWAASRIVGGL